MGLLRRGRIQREHSAGAAGLLEMQRCRARTLHLEQAAVVEQLPRSGLMLAQISTYW
jgi:hypothetical protein